MADVLETPEQQIAVIEANAEKISEMSDRGYKNSGEKGTVVLLRQLENNSTELEEWQFQYRPMSSLDSMLSDWKQMKLQEMLIAYNPDVSVVCTFLYPNGTHSSYHFGKV
ncbi:hypothetical protein [Arthrospira platensis]|jgi:hypothetical protein|uniref:Uncharacterized protein n=1 Tax=Limnospira platensis NIES-46 TaxID=1236695 RepID=A0A5M3T2I9_LIMPL|nr:hypothetical protein [Arthrospira platensis]AMW29557.1 hypothetical protein AP285_18145 [Arthrospira platensis YZ]MBD2669005.1 hypothetical protein [Arthrospira platensis FACHB-439]MBD2709587.1 hypothetical protein [Arthrospira platensis FACHB-835]MDF2212498.1 hypothetical protein [Arthrospira platensis NCB002]QQW27473.1 hypothetical protein AP9108_19870 [Arthrospira sp. PCC 9108]BAI91936.1 hypothetical protein NIES39_K02890 [Arthrospira platensis NIES-39]